LFFSGKQDAQNQLQLALEDFNTKRSALDTMERNAVRSAFAEERRRFCIFIKCLQPVMVLHGISLVVFAFFAFKICKVVAVNCEILHCTAVTVMTDCLCL